MKKLLLGLMLFGNLYCYSQIEALEQPQSSYIDHYSNVTPQTPNAASFTQYGNTPVDYSTGVPQISIPLFTIEEDGVQVPISISYHASGVKVDDLASSVGLKWTLNTGGGIFRNINSRPDEMGWLDPNTTSIETSWYESHDLRDVGQQLTLQSIAKWKDHAPDNFNYSFLGNSGSFIFKKDGTILKAKKDQIIIDATDLSLSFKAYDYKGTTYSFGTKESNSNTTVTARDYSLTAYGNVARDPQETGWMLDEITTPNHKTISFSYEEYNFEYTINNISQNFTKQPSAYFEDGSLNANGLTCSVIIDQDYTGEAFKESTSVVYRPKNQLISVIESSTIKADFIYEIDEINETLSDWKKKLIRIDIYDKLKGKTKQFHFVYGKFLGDPRLRLDEVYEVGFDGDRKPSHKFDYENTHLPNKGDFSKDLYGYYNGVTNNSSLVPLNLQGFATLPQQYQNMFADRTFKNEGVLKTGVLRSIVYPTGGQTKFNYEPNFNDGLETLHNTQVKVSTHLDSNPELINNEYIFDQLFTVDTSVQMYTSMFGDYTSFVSSESDVCDYLDENGFNIDCSKFNIYSAILQPNGDYTKGTPVFTPVDKVVGVTTVANTPAGIYILELRVNKDVLQNVNPWPLISVTLDWKEKRKDENGNYIKTPVYTGGLRIKNITDFNEGHQEAKKTEYEYSGYHGELLVDQVMTKSLLEVHKTVFSSEFALDANMYKSGYFYERVLVKNVSDEPTENIETEYNYEDASTTKSFSSQLKKVIYFKEGSPIKDKENFYERTSDIIYWNILGEMDLCYSHNNENDNGTYDQLVCSGIPCARAGYTTGVNTFFKGYEDRLTHTITKDYFANDVLESKTYYTYNDDLLVTNQVTATSQYSDAGQLEQRMSTSITYPKDYPNETTLQSLVDDNVLAIPISKKTYNKNELVYGQFNSYDVSGNIKEVFTHNKGKGSNTSSLSYIPSDYESISTFTHNAGKPTQIVKNTGETVSYVWDKSNTYVLAKITNATLAQASVLLTQGLDLDLSVLTDSQLRDELDKIRQGLPNAQVTTYTYEPLVGVTSVTDARGYTSTYHYDEFSRLQYVKDAEGNILSKNDYNYRPQN